MGADHLVEQAILLGRQDRLAEAEQLLRQAVLMDPASFAAHFNLAVALERREKLDDATEHFRRSVEMRPDHGDARLALANALHRLNRVTEAIDVCRSALSIDPDNAEIHGVLARLLLLTGDFKRGWAEYEWRWKCASFNEPRRQLNRPRWNGSGARDKVILLHHEQGFGDTIQFARYATLLARERGARVVLRVPKELVRLLRRLDGVEDVLCVDDPIPIDYDAHAPLMSMPMLMGTTLKTIPAATPYLSAYAAGAEQWRQRLEGDGAARLRIGLAWAGRATHPNDKRRSISLETLKPLTQLGDDVRFYSLQKWQPAGGADASPNESWVMNAAKELNDFADTAALVANLDVVVTVDTAVAHLAGAMGKCVLVLLPFCPDFRWMLGRDDSPWYPTMRLFRQTTAGEWDEAVECVVRELR